MPSRPRTDGKARGKRKAKTAHPLVTRTPGEGPGQPLTNIPLDALYAAARSHASFETLEKIFGVSSSTLSTRADYREVIEKARAEKKKELLEAQFVTAISDRNPTMLIWLGKQYLDQKDVQRVENTGADGQPVQTESVTKVVAYIPDNGRDG